MQEEKESRKLDRYDRLYAEWIHHIYFDLDCVISDEQWQLLIDTSLVKTNQDFKHKPPIKEREGYAKHKRNWKISHENEIRADANIQITEIEDDFEKIIHFAKSDIKKEEWYPESNTNHTPEFVAFINSINNAYPHIKNYEPFQLYCQQADDWFAQGEAAANYNDSESLWSFYQREYDRCCDNTLYFAIKYAFYLDTDERGGMKLFWAGNDVLEYLHARIRFFLHDCGYSTICGKPRQIGDSTINGIIAIKMIVFYSHVFCKFITKDEQKGKEILRDKFLFVYSNLVDWMREGAPYASTKYLTIGTKDEKGRLPENASRIEMSVPNTDAINGGQPRVVFIDEADTIPNLEEMTREGIPALYKKQKDGSLKLTRQIHIWSTGVYGDNSRGAFERLYKRYMGNWKDSNFYAGVIPLFFNWRARCPEKQYKEFEEIYTGTKYMKENNLDSESARIQFNMHFPSCIEDMFYTSENLLLPVNEINKQINRLHDLPHEERQIYGYFEPILDLSCPVENQDLSFKLIGARFKPCDEGDVRATTIIAYNGMPDYCWKNRYYAGSDTIDTDSGMSKQSTSIYDRVTNSICAVMNFRKQYDTNYTFLQSVLLTLFYDTDNNGRYGCKELIENNRAKSYYTYKETKQLIKNVVYNRQLPDYFWGGSSIWGINNKKDSNPQIIAYMRELYEKHGDNFLIDIAFMQMKTFESVQTPKNKQSVWGTKDKRRFLDDVLFSDAYAYICARSFDRVLPVNEGADDYQPTYKTKVVYDYDKDGNLLRDVKRVKVA